VVGKVKRGIPSFYEDVVDYEELSHKEMLKINAAAKKIGWKKALDSITDLEMISPHYIKNPTRADFRFLLSISKGSTILDVGCGMGTHTDVLARLADKVVGIETSLDRLEFTKTRVEQEGLGNVELYQASILEPPFAPGTFDFILFNGLLEWVALGSDANPRETQLAALRKANNLLKPGGVLYIGIENRFAFKQFLGHKDPHSGVRFTGVVPRFIANIMMKVFLKKKENRFFRSYKQKDAYRTYTYSHLGYRKLLREAGFNGIRFFVVRPSYNKQADFADMGSPGALRHFFRNTRLKKLSDVVEKTFLRDLWFKLFAVGYQHFLILAYKS
jgi:SAM-dependent methyltransferase